MVNRRSILGGIAALLAGAFGIRRASAEYEIVARQAATVTMPNYGFAFAFKPPGTITHWELPTHSEGELIRISFGPGIRRQAIVLNSGLEVEAISEENIHGIDFEAKAIEGGWRFSEIYLDPTEMGNETWIITWHGK